MAKPNNDGDLRLAALDASFSINRLLNAMMIRITRLECELAEIKANKQISIPAPKKVLLESIYPEGEGRICKHCKKPFIPEPQRLDRLRNRQVYCKRPECQRQRAKLAGMTSRRRRRGEMQ